MKALSKSEIESWLLCQRKWGLEKLDGLRYENVYAAFGTGCATGQEHWLKNSTPPDPKTPEGQVVLAAIPHWPHPSKIQSVEADLHAHSGAYPYHGLHDLLFYDTDLGLWTIGDLKTTGNLKYAKTRDDLLEDIQFNIYGLATMENYNVDEVAGRWLYVLRNKPHTTRVVNVETDKRRVLKVFREKIDPAAEQIHAAYSKFGPGEGKSLPPSVNSCGAFGGCPHVAVCNLSAKERLVAFMANDSLKQRLMSGGSLAKGNVVPINGQHQQLVLEAPAMEAKVDPSTVPDDVEDAPKASLAAKLGKKPSTPKAPKADPPPKEASSPLAAKLGLKTAALSGPAAVPVAGPTVAVEHIVQEGISTAVAAKPKTTPTAPKPETVASPSESVRRDNFEKCIDLYIGCRPVGSRPLVHLLDYFKDTEAPDAGLRRLLEQGVINRGDAVFLPASFLPYSYLFLPYATNMVRAV